MARSLSESWPRKAVGVEDGLALGLGHFAEVAEGAGY